MTEPPPGLLRERARRQGSLLVFCSLIFLQMLKAHVDMAVRRQPLGFMSALCGEPLVQPEALRWVFCFSRAELETDGGELSARSHSAPLAVMVDLSRSWKVQNFTYWGSCHSTSGRGTQHFWQSIQNVPWDLKSSGRLMNAKEKHLRCYARRLKLNVLLFQSFGRFKLWF